MGKKLNTFVHVRNKDGANTVFGPDDDVPEWAVEQIKNESVWDDGASKDDTDADDDAAPVVPEDDDTPVAPSPRRGRPPKQRTE